MELIPSSASVASTVRTLVPGGVFSGMAAVYGVLINCGSLSFTSNTDTRTVVKLNRRGLGPLSFAIMVRLYREFSSRSKGLHDNCPLVLSNVNFCFGSPPV